MFQKQPPTFVRVGIIESNGKKRSLYINKRYKTGDMEMKTPKKKWIAEMVKRQKEASDG